MPILTGQPVKCFTLSAYVWISLLILTDETTHKLTIKNLISKPAYAFKSSAVSKSKQSRFFRNLRFAPTPSRSSRDSFMFLVLILF